MEIDELARDLRDEQEWLDGAVAGLAEGGWLTPTPSPGWAVRDQIGHLAYFDATATLAITDPDAFQAGLQDLLASDDMDGATLHRQVAPSVLLATWRGNRRRLAEAVTGLKDGDRVPWYGPSMSAKSFLTARLMETWAHGQDVVDALGLERPATDRLRHIGQLGFITRGWSYANRGEEPPPVAVRVELVSPSGRPWRYGPDDATEVVRGPALDFCLVVTQRRHVDDTGLEVEGAAARDWMTKAQAFAGPATTGPGPGGHR